MNNNYGYVMLALLLLACVEDGKKNCTGPGPGAPGSGIDLTIEDATGSAGGDIATITTTYFNAGEGQAEAALLPDGTLSPLIMAVYFDDAECPPTGSTGDLSATLPGTVPAKATAEVGVSGDITALSSGDHTFFVRIDATNASWEVDEFNNCFGPATLSVP